MNTTDKKLPALDPRLACAASMVRQGAVIADIGTDHAYIPVYLTLAGISPCAIAADINKGPLERARMNAEKYGAADRIRFALADGLRGIEPEKENVKDIVICGMGGELIARIVTESDYTKNPDVHLILQPMTCPDDLRRELSAAGYAVLDENLCESAGRIYTCILAAYTGEAYELSPAEMLLGPVNIAKRDGLFLRYLEREINRLKIRIAGMERGGTDSAAEKELLRELEELRGN
ncbi:MAG: SAM-dependent methyltransferase [Clostridia bacterium]|nr:SAM-dependent methyltransferase [Clostridia bacterium]